MSFFHKSNFEEDVIGEKNDTYARNEINNETLKEKNNASKPNVVYRLCKSLHFCIQIWFNTNKINTEYEIKFSVNVRPNF